MFARLEDGQLLAGRLGGRRKGRIPSRDQCKGRDRNDPCRMRGLGRGNHRAYGIVLRKRRNVAKRKSRSFTSLTPRALTRSRGPKRAPFRMTLGGDARCICGDSSCSVQDEAECVVESRYHGWLRSSHVGLADSMSAIFWRGSSLSVPSHAVWLRLPR